MNNQPERTFHLHKDGKTVSFHIFEGCPGTTVQISVKYEKTGISQTMDLKSMSEARIVWTKYTNKGYVIK